MGAKRRAGPAAIAAALIGVGLALYRPKLVPELIPGKRGSATPAAPEFAAAIAWPHSTGSASAAVRSGRNGRPLAEESSTDERTGWRDALSDSAFTREAGPLAASRTPAAVSAVRPRAGLRDAPSSTERDPFLPLRAAAEAGAARRAPAASRAAVQAGVKAEPLRKPLSEGPAAPEETADTAAIGDGNQYPSTARRDNAAAWTRRQHGSFPLFRPPHRQASARGSPTDARRRARPLLLTRLLGRGALRPPPSSLVPPDLSMLAGKRPLLLPGGAPVPTRPFELERIEALDPRSEPAADDRRRTPHWHDGPLWHDGLARGVVADARWLWLWRDRTRWWAAEPESSPLLRHQGLWWSKRRGVWFALHEAELWSWRRFSNWDAEGLIRLTDGVELVYSADFAKVAVISPGEGAVLYDAQSGAELGHWLESELPRRRPRPPAELRLPRGI